MSASTTFTRKKVIDFRSALLRWFRKEQRELPWRGTKDPYRILVSEVMLQQTRVAVVKDRYREFLRAFPTATVLAQASEQSVLAAWSGLGYYRRARNLHASAKSIAKNGSFPSSAAELEQLPGVGRYTAAAVASIAYGEPVAVVDGNVKRVLGRVAGRDLSDAECWQSARQLLAEKHAGDFNQAMMELGALICLPEEPLCKSCPVTGQCVSRGAMPRSKSKPRLKATVRYALGRRRGRILLQQRDEAARLMPGMWELPLLQEQEQKLKKPVLKVRHAITTTDYTVLVFADEVAGAPAGKWVTLQSAGRMALTGLTRKILRKLELLQKGDVGSQGRR